MKRSSALSVLLVLTGAIVFTAGDAFAIPAFARKYNLACSSCHTSMPYVNFTGRKFKEGGFRMPDEDGGFDPAEQPSRKISEDLILGKVFPLAARIKGYVVDSKKGSDTKIRPIHEIEIFAAGSFWTNGSFFFELEGEDEESFETALAGNFGWHPSEEANIEVGFGSILHPDPYNSLKDGGHRLTVSHKIPLDIGKSVDLRLRKGAQYLSFYGRTSGLFYMAGLSAGNGNPEGENPQDVLGRVAYDFTPDIMFGGFVIDGTRDVADGELNLQRIGADFNFTFADFHLLGMAMRAEEELDSVTEENWTGYVEALYTVRKDGRPFFVPLARYGWTDLNDGEDKFAAITLQAGFHFIENAKFAFEYYKEVDVGPGKDELDRFTLLADIAF